MVKLFRAGISRMWMDGLSNPVLGEFRDWWVFLVTDWWILWEGHGLQHFFLLRDWWPFHPLFSLIEPMGWDGKIFLAAGSFG